MQISLRTHRAAIQPEYQVAGLQITHRCQQGKPEPICQAFVFTPGTRSNSGLALGIKAGFRECAIGAKKLFANGCSPVIENNEYYCIILSV
jgi:hypothetical protein